MDAAIRALFSPEPGTTYLDSATYGLPPEPSLRVMGAALDDWKAGRANWIEDWDMAGERGRAAFAALVGIDPGRVALLPATSVAVGLVAAELTRDDDVVVPADEFTSVLFPLLVARDRGVPVREVEFERLRRRDPAGPAPPARGDGGAGRRGRCARPPRCHPGDAVRGPRRPCRPDRLPGRLGLQAPPLPAWRGLHSPAPRPRRAPAADQRQLAGRRSALRPLLRRPADPRHRPGEGRR